MSWEKASLRSYRTNSLMGSSSWLSNARPTAGRGGESAVDASVSKTLPHSSLAVGKKRPAEELCLESDGDESASLSGYDSEAHSRTFKGRLGRSQIIQLKRRKPSSDNDLDWIGGSTYSNSSQSREPLPSLTTSADKDVLPLKIEHQANRPDEHPSNAAISCIPQKSVEAANKAERQTGVIYLSRIPPYMRPQTLRSLLSPFGSTERLFLTPESSHIRSARLQSSSAKNPNKRPIYIDGWVEFTRKADAKLCAETLNGRTLNEGEGGRKKGGWYGDDVWSMRYLRGFKWRDLIEQRRGEEEERAGRLRADEREGRREDRVFLKGIERSKVIEGIKANRERRAEARGELAKRASIQTHGSLDEKMTARRGFTQHSVVNPIKKPAGNPQVQSVLAKLF